ncbi:hypothetical protein [Haliangium ochraceum]|uniref:PKD domain-containing protein n=1 Tax=Haliangium ochraceum (strain DSM 14365 / JCM 11303 / SMP-2) TaxID=502025 RepID=D0LZ36_HALO1|nr:hypothetical protein [Haliangium ochraceum]ACY14506.1 hypothetical protein Hoch_1960 [Haliangium ochraceum DSM 14365]
MKRLSSHLRRASLAFPCVLLSACLFAESINQAPRANVQVVTTGVSFRGDQLSFSASKSDDPDGDSLFAFWRARTCDAEHIVCDAVFDERSWLRLGADFSVTIPPQRPNGEITGAVLVELVVRDNDGAEHGDRVFVDVGNQPPAPALQLQGFAAPQGGFPIGTRVRAVATASDPDGDPVSYAWRYVPAPSSQPEAVVWEQVSDAVYELTGDVVGAWEIEVSATDPLGATTTQRATVQYQRDEPPCIQTTAPLALAESSYVLERSQPPRRFSVLSVDDDLDVYPAPPELTADGRPSPQGTARFRWQLATPDTGGALEPIGGHALAGYVIDPAGFAPGDELRLRVEIEDRNAYEVVCDPASPTCALFDDAACLQRVTWRVEIR